MANMSNFNDGTTSYAVRDAQAEALLVDNAGKNLLPLTLQSIKTINPYGTWNDNVYTIYGVTFTINTNDTGYVTNIVANRISNADDAPYLFLIDRTNVVFTNDNYILSGVLDASPNTYHITYISPNWNYGVVYNNDKVMNVGTGISRIRIDIGINYNANNVIFYPMVRRKQITDSTFEPYYRTQKQLDSDLSTVDADLTAVEDKVSGISKDNTDNLSIANYLGNINVSSGNDGINISAGTNVNISSDGSANITSDSGAVNLTASDGNVNIEANNLYVTIDGESRMTLKAYIQGVVDGTI